MASLRKIDWYVKTVFIALALAAAYTFAVAYATIFARDLIVRAGYQGADLPGRQMVVGDIVLIWLALGVWLAYRTLAHLYARSARRQQATNPGAASPPAAAVSSSADEPDL